MKNNVPFLRWLLIIVPVTVMLIIAQHFGLYQDIHEYDKSFISFTVLAMFILQSMFVGFKTYSSDSRGSQFGWFVSDACLTLGMIGTIVGFLMMLRGGFTIASGDAAGIQALLARFSVGLGTALYTTLAGLVCSMLLKLQLFNLGHSLGQIKDD
jgi:hypothetical protein